jgi:hypothetical protein
MGKENVQPAPSEPEAESDAATRSREAAGYRRRLREAEADVEQRDGVIGALRAEVDRLHRLEAERIAGQAMATPADFWMVADLTDLRDDDGRLHAEKVTRS